MKNIIINSVKHGQHTILVDDEDYELVNKLKWSISIRESIPYVHNSFNNIDLQRFIMEPSKEYVVDHKNRNTLDNRRCNLRICKKYENNRNKRIQSNNTTGYKGVTKVSNASTFRAVIKVGRKTLHLGCFIDKKDAANAYNEAAKIYYGEFALLNKL